MLEAIFSWNTLWVIMWALYLPACIGLIVIVLLQKGKSSGFAGAFGAGGGSETVFGPRARKSLPVKLTYAMATLFMVLSMSMSLVAGRVHRGVAPELVEVEETITADEIFGNLLGDVPEADSSTEAPSTPSIMGAATPEEATEPAAEAPVEEIVEETVEPDSASEAEPSAAPDEPAGEAPTEDAASAS
jgi:preprotein translocase subunit SecG